MLFHPAQWYPHARGPNIFLFAGCRNSFFSQKNKILLFNQNLGWQNFNRVSPFNHKIFFLQLNPERLKFMKNATKNTNFGFQTHKLPKQPTWLSIKCSIENLLREDVPQKNLLLILWGILIVQHLQKVLLTLTYLHLQSFLLSNYWFHFFLQGPNQQFSNCGAHWAVMYYSSCRNICTPKICQSFWLILTMKFIFLQHYLFQSSWRCLNQHLFTGGRPLIKCINCFLASESWEAENGKNVFIKIVLRFFTVIYLQNYQLAFLSHGFNWQLCASRDNWIKNTRFCSFRRSFDSKTWKNCILTYPDFQIHVSSSTFPVGNVSINKFFPKGGMFGKLTLLNASKSWKTKKLKLVCNIYWSRFYKLLLFQNYKLDLFHQGLYRQLSSYGGPISKKFMAFDPCVEILKI